MTKTFNITVDTLKPAPRHKLFEIWRGDNISFNFTFKEGDETLDTSSASKLRVYAKRVVCNEVRQEDEPLFASESDTLTEISFASQYTAGAAGHYLLVIMLLDSSGNTITSQGVYFDLLQNGYAGIFTPSEDFRDACMYAKADAEAAATTAIAKASEAGESASAAAASADAASISAQDANNAKNTAVEAKDAAGAYAGDCAGYAATASTKATEATTAANFAAEVSRIAIVPITATSQTIQPNKCYTLLTNDVDAYTLTPEMPSGNPEYLLQAVVQLKTGSAAPVINWGGNPSFFNGKIPTINANSSYDVIFEFDNLTLSWTVGVMKK